MKVYFSVNDYDKDGDLGQKGIYWHFGETRIKVANTLKELQETIDGLKPMVKEIKENYKELT